MVSNGEIKEESLVNSLEVQPLQGFEDKNGRGSYLLQDFFSKRDSANVVLLLNGALNIAHLLFPHMSKINLLTYSPRSAYHKMIRNPGLLVGIVESEYDTLIFDTDMLTGRTVRETLEMLRGEEVNPVLPYVYLHLGTPRRNSGPLIENAIDLLKKNDDYLASFKNRAHSLSDLR